MIFQARAGKSTPPSRYPRIVSRRHRYMLLMALLVAALLGIYLAGNGRAPLFDRDEPRYALASRAMLQSGDWVVPRLLGEVRTAKPPAIYWLQAGAMRVFGTGEFAVRLPAALACAATVLLLAVLLPPLAGRRRAAWACFMLGTGLLVLGVAKVGVIDGVLLLCASAMQIALLRLLRQCGGSRGNAILLWTAIGFGGLLKGPVILGVLLTTLLGFFALIQFAPADAERRTVPGFLLRMHPVLGLLILAMICGPWLVMISLREPGFLAAALAHDVAARSVRGLEGHGQPPGFHLLALFGTWFPWSVLLPAALIHAWRRKRGLVMRFALAACIGPWIMFELVVTKLPHYLLVIFPMLALLTADWIVPAMRGRMVNATSLKFAAMIYGIVAVGFAIAPYGLGAPSWLAASLSVGWAVALVITWWHGQIKAGALLAGGGMAAIVATAYLHWIDRVPALALSQRVAAALDVGGAQEALMVHYKEPSLAWYAAQRGIIVREADEELLASAEGFAVSTRQDLDGLDGAVRQRWQVIGVIPARLYNDDLRPAEVLVLRRSPPKAVSE